MPESTVLDAVTIHGKKTKIANWAGWEVGWRAPFDTIKGAERWVDGGKS